MRQFLYIVIVFLCGCTPSLQHIPATITQCCDIPVGRASAIAWCFDSKGYLFGGRDSINVLHNDLWEYDPVRDSWKQIGDSTPLTPRVNGVACVVGEHVYVGLGFQQSIHRDSSYLRDWWEYNPIKNEWKQLADFPNKNTVKPIAYVQGNRIYCVHGFGVGFTAEIIAYDIVTNQWEIITQHSHNDIMCMAGAGATLDGRFYYGTGFNTMNLNTWFEIGFEGEWEKRANVPGKRQLATCVITAKNIYLVGGRKFGGTQTDGKIYDDILRYNTQDDVWTYAGSTKYPTENSFGFSINHSAYIGGGENGDGILTTLYRIED